MTCQCARIDEDALRVEHVAREGVLVNEYNLARRLLFRGPSYPQELEKTAVDRIMGA